jgi:hypothetical protein
MAYFLPYIGMKKTAAYYASHPKAHAVKLAYQKAYNRRPDERKRRTELTQINRDRGTHGNGDGLDASHTQKGVVMKKASVNRGSKTDAPGDRRTRGKK